MRPNTSNTYTDDDIERAMATVARVIELYGETYWPILERLETELEDRRARAARLNKHLKRFQIRRAQPDSQLPEKELRSSRRSVS